jgi:hypothetical protein
MCERGITQSCTGRLVRYYFVRTLVMNDDKPDGTENATQNTFPKLTWICFLSEKHKTKLAVQLHEF